MFTKKLGITGLLIAGVSTLLVAACATTPGPVVSAPRDKDGARLQNNQVMKRGNNFNIRAFYVQGVCEKGPDFNWDVMTRIVNVGGTTIAFDLVGFNEDGTKLDPAAVETVKSYAEHCHNSHTAPMVRLLASIPPDQPVRRKAAIQTAASVFADCQRVFYWIDGPDAAALTRLFRKRAPQLFTISPAGGHLTLVDSPGRLTSSLVMANGFLPDNLETCPHFVVPDDPALYALLDERLTSPEEKQPWNPDPSILSEEEAREGFLPLFDGKTLNGWRPWKAGVCSYEPRNGCLEWVRPGGDALVTTRRFDNFILRFEWKIVENGNSGVWLRAPRAGRASKYGFEFQILGDSKDPEITKTSTGSIYDVIPPLCRPIRPEGEWNAAELILDGPRYKAYINGVLVQDINFDEHEELRYRLRKGFICLTDHGHQVSYRNIRIKPL
ncbi:MAG TPA: DUF1080 domain-containing protein [Candidatus Hydrogenedentes bacterium]|nr:DUF1080 domain-containing protein [Candidatus Hydrogenedentota bacterium]